MTARPTTMPILMAIGATLLCAGCATESARTLEVPTVRASAAQPPAGPPVPLAVGRFDNRSNYAMGVFSDGVDRLGGQAKTTLVAHLQQSRRFEVLERENLAETGREAAFAGTPQRIRGASFLVTGDITEFGRREVGDQQLFGLLGRGRQQVAYAKVTLNVVDPVTSRVVWSARGAGEFALSTREVAGFGGTATYDATLNGKVLDLAVREAVDALVLARESGSWGPGARP
jgi:curli biogenesis system outer membrane secretion channel CsgG